MFFLVENQQSHDNQRYEVTRFYVGDEQQVQVEGKNQNENPPIGFGFFIQGNGEEDEDPPAVVFEKYIGIGEVVFDKVRDGSRLDEVLGFMGLRFYMNSNIQPWPLVYAAGVLLKGRLVMVLNIGIIDLGQGFPLVGTVVVNGRG